MNVFPITVVHNYKKANLQTQPKREYWKEDKSISRCFKNKTTLDDQLVYYKILLGKNSTAVYQQLYHAQLNFLMMKLQSLKVKNISFH